MKLSIQIALGIVVGVAICGICLTITCGACAGWFASRTINSPAVPIPDSLHQRESQSQTKPNDPVSIVSIETKETETNTIWSRYAYRLKIANVSSVPVTLNATLEWQDRDGFVIDTEDIYNLIVKSKDTALFTGFQLIDKPAADNVANIYAKVFR